MVTASFWRMQNYLWLFKKRREKDRVGASAFHIMSLLKNVLHAVHVLVQALRMQLKWSFKKKIRLFIRLSSLYSRVQRCFFALELNFCCIRYFSSNYVHFLRLNPPLFFLWQFVWNVSPSVHCTCMHLNIICHLLGHRTGWRLCSVQQDCYIILVLPNAEICYLRCSVVGNICMKCWSRCDDHLLSPVVYVVNVI